MSNDQTEMGDRRTAVVQTWLILAGLTFVAIIAFLPALWGDFLEWDDRQMVAENLFLQPGSGLSFAFVCVRPHLELYAPLNYTAYAVIANVSSTISGHLSPFAFHATSLILHCAGGWIAYRLLLLLTAHALASGFGAAIWPLHPLQVEPVAWISSLNTVLSGLLGLYALYLAALSATSDQYSTSKRWFVAACIAATLSFFSKPAGVGFALALFGLDRFIFNMEWRKSVVRAGIWVALAVPFVVVARLSQTASDVPTLPLIERLQISGHILSFYLWKILWPATLVPDYGMNPWRVLAEPQLRYAGLALIPVVGLTVWAARRRPWIYAAALVFLAGIIPVAGLVKFDFQGYSSVADRYLYFALFGVAILATFLLKAIKSKRAAVVTASILIVVLAVRSHLQSYYWQDSIRLMQHTIAVTPNSLGANIILGIAAHRSRDFSAAEQCYLRVLAYRPKHAPILYHYGNLLVATHRPAEAVNRYRAALAINSSDPVVYNNLGIAHTQLGQNNEALTAFDQAIRLYPNYADAYLNAGTTFRNMGRLADARQVIAKAMQIDPSNERARAALQDMSPAPN